jgi:hypothetical protein
MKARFGVPALAGMQQMLMIPPEGGTPNFLAPYSDF